MKLKLLLVELSNQEKLVTMLKKYVQKQCFKISKHLEIRCSCLKLSPINNS